MNIVTQPLYPLRLCLCRLTEIPLFSTGHHIRVGFKHNTMPRKPVQRRLQHGLKTTRISLAILHRCITKGLVHHQHVGFQVLVIPLAGVVVLGHPPRAPTANQITRPGLFIQTKGPSQQYIQPAGLAGIVINTPVIPRQRHRRFRAWLNRTQKAIFQAHHRQTHLPGCRLCLRSRGLTAPSQHGPGSLCGKARAVSLYRGIGERLQVFKGVQGGRCCEVVGVIWHRGLLWF